MGTRIEPFEAQDSNIDGLKIINAKMVTDDRGTVRELFRGSVYSDVLPETVTGWKQINLTRTKKGAVRGLHGEAMSKLVTVAYGSVFGAYVDTRPDSKTFGAVQTVHITPGVQVFVPQGVCNGFQALEDSEYLYFFDNEWAPGMPGTALCPIDPELGIDWPIKIDSSDLNQISEKDSKAPTLKELKKNIRSNHMTKRERVLAALNNQPVDKVPMGFWYHFSPDEDLGEQTVKDHINWYNGAELDFIKVMCDGYFNYPNPTLQGVTKAADLYNLKPLPENHPFIDNQVWRVKRIVEEVGQDTCIFYNVFNPMSQLRFGTSEEFVMRMVKEDPEAFKYALRVISQDTKKLIERLFTEAHADGIYFCVQNAEKWRFTPEEYCSLIKPLEVELLEFANSFSENNMLHCCGWAGDENNLIVWQDYPVKAVNWAVYVEHMSLQEGKKFFGGKCVLGGFANTKDGILYKGSDDELINETQAILRASGMVGVMLGADCSIPSDIRWDKFKIISRARNIHQ